MPGQTKWCNKLDWWQSEMLVMYLLHFFWLVSTACL